jgi:hypothetical protein
MLIVLSLLTFSPWTLASGEEVKMQGLIMNIDLKQNTMVVNEKTFTWRSNTAIHNDKGSPITMDRFKQNAWVYIEGEKDENNRMHIKKIYLLPKRVDKKEMHLYPFME